MESIEGYDASQDVELLEIVEGYVIDSKTEFDAASDLLVLVKIRMKSLEEFRVDTVKPLNVQVKAINDRFRPYSDRLALVERRLKTMIGAFQLKQREEQQRLLRAAAEEAAKQTEAENTKALALRQQAQETVVPHKAGITSREVWTWELLDEDKVPVTYKSVDKRKVDAAVKAGTRDIPGVRVFTVPSVTVRTK